eukprot:PhF_6_TR43267/c0_g1_i1/m.66195
MEKSGLSSYSPGTISGVFFTKKDADSAYNALLQRGHQPDDIAVLMSDETFSTFENGENLTVQEYDPEAARENADSLLAKAKDIISGVIVTATSVISIREWGIVISNALFRRADSTPGADDGKTEEEHFAGYNQLKEHVGSYGDTMKEGGIIISVDPKNKEDRRAIVRAFRANNGHDILGDDGYTELD